MATTAPTTLTFVDPDVAHVATLRRIVVVITRALRMDPGAMVRLVHARENGTDLLISTPLGCIAAQWIPAIVSEDGVVVAADPLASQLAAVASGENPAHSPLQLGGRLDMLWTGTAPPESGWTVVDAIPGVDVRQLFEQVRQEVEAHAGPAGLPPSLLDQPLLRLTSRTQTGIIEIPGSVVAALDGLGLVAEPREELRAHDRIRVSVTGSWIRVDALLGTVYLPRPGGLARIPSPR